MYISIYLYIICIKTLRFLRFPFSALLRLSELCDYTATALDNVELYMITEDGFCDLFRSMPDVKAQVIANAKEVQVARSKLMFCAPAPSFEIAGELSLHS